MEASRHYIKLTYNNPASHIRYYKEHLQQVKQAQSEGINVKGYFIWSFTDNFEWSEGYYPRFGIVYVDFKTLKRIVKDSGLWYSQFLEK